MNYAVAQLNYILALNIKISEIVPSQEKRQRAGALVEFQVPDNRGGMQNHGGFLSMPVDLSFAVLLWVWGLLDQLKRCKNYV